MQPSTKYFSGKPPNLEDEYPKKGDKLIATRWSYDAAMLKLLLRT